jgi:hypothetical protein
VREAFGWADASPSPTLGRTPAWLGGVSNTHSLGSRVLHETTVGYYDLQNTRISLNRDIFNSTLGIYNPLEVGIGGLAALMPTIDINTQRNSGGIGNAWDFFDIQRTLSASDKWSLMRGAHTVQFGAEFRRVNLQGEYMARTNGDLDYDNWALFFTGHGILRGPSQAELDLTITRSFPLGSRRHLQCRWDVFNALNTPVFTNPASTFAANGYGTAGQITSTIGGPRTMQVAARLSF